MSDAVAMFVAVRLEEDEAVARLAAREGGTWHQEEPERYPGSIVSMGGQVVYDEGAPDEYQAPFIARHDPARVLREVQAKRAILARHAQARAWSYPPGDGDESVQAELEVAIRHLATIWSDHPDYRDEWKP